MDKLDKILLNLTASAVGFFAGAMLAAYAVADDSGYSMKIPEHQPIVIEIERNLPDDRSFVIRREFNDLEDLLMWFENKVDHEGCDPYVDKVIMFPKGKD